MELLHKFENIILIELNKLFLIKTNLNIINLMIYALKMIVTRLNEIKKIQKHEYHYEHRNSI